MKRIAIFICSALLLGGAFCLPVCAQSSAERESLRVQIDPHSHQSYSLNPYLQVLIDTSHVHQIQEIDQHQTWIPYGPASTQIPAYAVLWGLVHLESQAEDTTEWALELGRIDQVQVRTSAESEIKYAGLKERVAQRHIKIGRNASVRLRIPPKEVVSVWIRLEENLDDPPYARLRLTEWDRWRTQILLHEWREMAFLNLFIGILSIMFCYNLILYFSVNQPSYLFYALYLLSLILTMYFENPVQGLHVLGANDPELNTLLSFLGFGSTSIFYLLFGRQFVGTAELTPRWDTWILRLVFLRSIALVSLGLYSWFSKNWDPGFMVMNILIAVEAGLLLIYFVVLFQSRSILARYFILGSGVVFVFGFFLIILRKFIPIENGFLLFFAAIVIEILIFSLGLGYRMRKEQTERLVAQQALNEELTLTNKAFGRFVPHEFIRSLGHTSVTDVQLGDQVEKEVTVFFTDIRSYTTLSEQMSPTENFNFLNAYLGRMGPIIKDRGGFVNQYLGDGIMGIFMDIPDDALFAAIEMQQSIHAYNQERIPKGRLPIQVGIGLHSGPLMMGVIGDARRMDAGVVADAVNTASRLEGLTKHFGVSILISEDLLDELFNPNEFQIRYLGKVIVKGKQTPFKVYECFDGDLEEIKQLKQETLSAYHIAIEAYFNQDFPTAQQAFQDVLDHFPNDPVSGNYLIKVNEMLRHGIPEAWTGIEIMQVK